MIIYDVLGPTKFFLVLKMQEECAIGEMKISDLSKRNEELNRETEELR